MATALPVNAGPVHLLLSQKSNVHAMEGILSNVHIQGTPW
jgi:hypothetical protein